MTFGQRSFVVIYFKVTVLRNSLVINCLAISSPASKRERQVNVFQAGRVGPGPGEPQPPCAMRFRGRLGAARPSELVDLPLQVLEHGVHALGRAPDLLQHLALPLVGLLQLQLSAAAHEGLGFHEHNLVAGGELLKADHDFPGEGPGPEYLGAQAFAARRLRRQLPPAEQRFVRRCSSHYRGKHNGGTAVWPLSEDSSGCLEPSLFIGPNHVTERQYGRSSSNGWAVYGCSDRLLKLNESIHEVSEGLGHLRVLPLPVVGLARRRMK